MASNRKWPALTNWRKASEENSLVGQVTMDGDNRFVFKLAGNNPADTGLTFTK